MISSIRGTVLSTALDHAVVEVGGVGLAVQAAPSTLATLRVNEQAHLHTTLVVREDSLTLYGFVDLESRELFTLLQTVSGIGPRLALAALAVLEPEALRSALSEGNIGLLTKVPGIGKKGAERLSLELRDKIATVATDGSGAAGTETAAQSEPVRAEVVEALVSLGFTARHAEQAVDGVLGDGGDGADGRAPDTSTVLRAALSTLGRRL
ncbi:Holliday junction branch migration protein RuvA [Haloechinothrix sp. YIM 98757]|uniref:Holliday junction branch migration complex subunit RuvA n=1 Tax=Haloechinothrix aidingensis TaxID=2752311 RepID=A0A838A9U7_9PSEU|nr:Holliday junction branch migration protein RuvA [Haloechinothrix aidingensis]MBA0126027.1 Holliday junction branch migration protein RuvA [Haloechinothrix aidingensis]